MSLTRLVRHPASLAPLVLALALAGVSVAACASPAPRSPDSTAERTAAGTAGADQAVGGTAAAPAEAGQPAAAGYRRIELPGGEGKPFPYTVEIPADWQIHQVPNTASLWLGPPSAKPGDPTMIV